MDDALTFDRAVEIAQALRRRHPGMGLYVTIHFVGDADVAPQETLRDLADGMGVAITRREAPANATVYLSTSEARSLGGDDVTVTVSCRTSVPAPDPHRPAADAAPTPQVSVAGQLTARNGDEA